MTAIMAIAATPPTTPPAIAPTEVEGWDVGGVSVPEVVPEVVADELVVDDELAVDDGEGAS